MLVTSTLSNAEARKEAKKIATSCSVYTTKEEMMAFIGSPILMVYMQFASIKKQGANPKLKC